MRSHPKQWQRALSLRLKIGPPFRRAKKVLRYLSKRRPNHSTHELAELNRQLKILEKKKNPSREEIEQINTPLEKYTPLKEKKQETSKVNNQDLLAAKYAMETIPLFLEPTQRAPVLNFIYEVNT